MFTKTYEGRVLIDGKNVSGWVACKISKDDDGSAPQYIIAVPNSREVRDGLMADQDVRLELGNGKVLHLAGLLGASNEDAMVMCYLRHTSDTPPF